MGKFDNQRLMEEICAIIPEIGKDNMNKLTDETFKLQGVSMLWMAVKHKACTRELVELLVLAGANVNFAEEDYNHTVLFNAIHEHANIGVIEALLAAGANPTARSAVVPSPCFFVFVSICFLDCLS